MHGPTHPLKVAASHAVWTYVR